MLAVPAGAAALLLVLRVGGLHVDRLAHLPHARVAVAPDVDPDPLAAAGELLQDLDLLEDQVLQRARGVDSIGRVTEFEVEIEDAAQADAIMAQIDEMFKSDEIQTTTKSHKAFISSATGDLLGLVKFTRWLGLICVLVVLGLTANTVYVMVQDRVKEHAVLQTLSFPGHYLFGMVICESLVLSIGGGILGTAVAALLLRYGNLGLGAEGVQIGFMLTPAVVAGGMAASAITGVLAGVMPAIQSAVAPIVDSLRKV